MNVLIDMNLSPLFVALLHDGGHVARHWITIGRPNATDLEIMSWARDHDHVVATNDLDFGAILATTGRSGPSVLQARTQDVSPAHLGPLIIQALREFAAQLEVGALVVIHERRSRVRILPIRDG